RDMQRVVEHLRNAIPGSSRGPAGLAVVAIDDERAAAEALLALAVSLAQQHRRVVVADLSSGAHAARLAGTHEPGLHTVNLDGVSVMLVVPAANDVSPAGPLSGPASSNGRGWTRSGQQLAVSCAESDIILSLVTLDPAFGGDHLAEWATEAVLMVTAGASTAV